MLLRMVINFFLNNQPDAIIIQMYSVIKHYIFRASCLPIISASGWLFKRQSILLRGNMNGKFCFVCLVAANKIFTAVLTMYTVLLITLL
jgi:hypothetical protein